MIYIIYYTIYIYNIIYIAPYIDYTIYSIIYIYITVYIYILLSSMRPFMTPNGLVKSGGSPCCQVRKAPQGQLDPSATQ